MRGARFVDWQHTTTHKEVSISEMTVSPSCTMTTVLSWLLLIAKYSKLVRISGKYRQATTEKKICVTSKRSSGSSRMVYVDVSLQLRIVEDRIKKLSIFNSSTIIHGGQRVRPLSSMSFVVCRAF
jgi:hypothetical protein